MNNLIINIDDFVKLKSNGKIYCIVSLSHSLVIGKDVNDKSKEIDINDIEKIIFKDIKQSKIEFDTTIEDKIKSIIEDLKNKNLTLKEIQKLKYKKDLLESKIKKENNDKNIIVESIQNVLF